MTEKEMLARIAQLEKENFKLKSFQTMTMEYFPIAISWSRDMEEILPKEKLRADYADALSGIVRRICVPPVGYRHDHSDPFFQVRDMEDGERYHKVMCEILTILKKNEYKKEET